MDALADIEEPLRKAAEKGLMGDITPPPEPDPRAMQAFTLYHGQSLDGLNLVNSRMLESTAEAYRGMVADITNRLLNARGTINAATGEVLTRKQSTGLFPASLGRRGWRASTVRVGAISNRPRALGERPYSDAAAAGGGADRVCGRRRTPLEAGHLRGHDDAQHLPQCQPGGVLGAE